MTKYGLMLGIFSLACANANANGWDLEVGLENQRFDDSSGDFSFYATAFTAGYRWDFDEDTSGTLEGTITFGFGTDRFTVVVADINVFMGLGYRVTQTLDEDWSVYGRVMYAQTGLDLTIENIGGEVSAEETGLGFGGGVMWRGVTLGYTLYTGDLEDYSAVNLGYRWQF